MQLPGKPQATFTSGEIAEEMWFRTEAQIAGKALRKAVNIEPIPQGGFRLAPGTWHRAILSGSAARLETFVNSHGDVYTAVMDEANICLFLNGVLAASVSHGFGAYVAEMTYVQSQDTAIFCHVAKQMQRLIETESGFTFDSLPLDGIQNYDYGETYTNGVAAQWELEFVGFDDTSSSPTLDGISFYLTVSKQTTAGMHITSSGGGPNGGATAATIENAILALSNVWPGVTVTHSGGWKWLVTFNGTGNEGDGWALSGTVTNRSDAAVCATRVRAGALSGEPIISSSRGWPRGAAFYLQRLLLYGLYSLPNAYMISKTGDYFQFDIRGASASDPFLVPMDVPSDEEIRYIIAGRWLTILTSQGEYWISDRSLDKTQAPSHVSSSKFGCRLVRPVQSEGSILFVKKESGSIGEFRYTDVTGDYATGDLSLFATHIATDITAWAMQKAKTAKSANRLFYLRGDGSNGFGIILREQEVTGFTRLETDGKFISFSVDTDNRSWAISARQANATNVRHLEEFDDEQLLQDAIKIVNPGKSAIISGLSHLNGSTVWALGDDDVYGPFAVVGGSITLPRAVAVCTVGRWTPPEAVTLPVSRSVGNGIELTGKQRIHSVHVKVKDTTSIAISVNGGALQDQPLFKTGEVGDRPELQCLFSGQISKRGLKGYRDDPYVTISQVRPGRLHVLSITLEMA